MVYRCLKLRVKTLALLNPLAEATSVMDMSGRVESSSAL
jgi:hypothetical protein